MGRGGLDNIGDYVMLMAIGLWSGESSFRLTMSIVWQDGLSRAISYMSSLWRRIDGEKFGVSGAVTELCDLLVW